MPDSVAIEYKSDLWSERHFQLIEKSMSFLGKVGTAAVYLPLISETNQGNAELMVRWIPKPDGSYDYDFAPLERYLDAAEKHLGKPLGATSALLAADFDSDGKADLVQMLANGGLFYKGRGDVCRSGQDADRCR